MVEGLGEPSPWSQRSASPFERRIAPQLPLTLCCRKTAPPLCSTARAVACKSTQVRMHKATVAHTFKFVFARERAVRYKPMVIVFKLHGICLPPPIGRHSPFPRYACVTDVIVRGSVGLNPDSFLLYVPPSPCFAFSPTLCGLECFISLVRMRVNPLFSPHTVPVQTPPSQEQALTHSL